MYTSWHVHINLRLVAVMVVVTLLLRSHCCHGHHHCVLGVVVVLRLLWLRLWLQSRYIVVAIIVP